MRSEISATVAQSEPNTRTQTSPIESPRSSLERRVISPGSPTITATRSSPSMSGRTQFGPGRTPFGSRNVNTIADTTAPAIGQRGSPVTGLSLSASADTGQAFGLGVGCADWNENDHGVARPYVGRSAIGGDAQAPIACNREERDFCLSGREAACAPAHDPRAGGKLPVELGERERAVAEDAGLARRWQQVRLVGVGSDSIDVLVAELVPKLSGAEGVEVVAVRQQQCIGDLLEL